MAAARAACGARCVWLAFPRCHLHDPDPLDINRVHDLDQGSTVWQERNRHGKLVGENTDGGRSRVENDDLVVAGQVFVMDPEGTVRVQRDRADCLEFREVAMPRVRG